MERKILPHETTETKSHELTVSSSTSLPNITLAEIKQAKENFKTKERFIGYMPEGIKKLIVFTAESKEKSGNLSLDQLIELFDILKFIQKDPKSMMHEVVGTLINKYNSYMQLAGDEKNLQSCLKMIGKNSEAIDSEIFAHLLKNFRRFDKYDNNLAKNLIDVFACLHKQNYSLHQDPNVRCLVFSYPEFAVPIISVSLLVVNDSYFISTLHKKIGSANFAQIINAYLELSQVDFDLYQTRLDINKDSEEPSSVVVTKKPQNSKYYSTLFSENIIDIIAQQEQHASEIADLLIQLHKAQLGKSKQDWIQTELIKNIWINPSFIKDLTRAFTILQENKSFKKECAFTILSACHQPDKAIEIVKQTVEPKHQNSLALFSPHQLTSIDKSTQFEMPRLTRTKSW